MLPGPTELIVVLVIVLIIFGPGKLPQVFRSLGEGLKSFRDAQQPESAVDVTPDRDQISEQDVQDIEVVPERRSASAEPTAREQN